MTSQPANLAFAETKTVSSPRAHPVLLQTNQPRSTSASKLDDRNLIEETLANNPVILPTATPLDASSGFDYDQRSVTRGPYVHVGGRLGDHMVDAIPTSDIHQYARAASGYDGILASRVPRDVASLHATVPILASPDRIRANAVPVNRFYGQQVESARVAPIGHSIPVRFSTGEAVPAALYGDVTLPNGVPRQFEPSMTPQPFQHYDANALLSNARSRMMQRPLDAATWPISAKSMEPRTNVIDHQIGSLPSYMDYILQSPQKSEDEGSIRSLTSDDMDDLIRRNERLLWRNAADVVGKLTQRPPDASNHVDLDSRATAILENELDKYINNIRKLHREHGVSMQGSQEEVDHEQNTSGDLLNVTLSEEAAELSVEDRVRKERMPEEMGRILALASDLAARTEPKEVTRLVSRDDDEARFVNEMEVGSASDTSKLERKRNLLADEVEKRGVSTLTRNEIREDVATRLTEAEQPRKDSNDADKLVESRQRDRVTFNARRDDTKREMSESLNNGSEISDRRSAPKEKSLDPDTKIGEESNIEEVFDTAKELAPWDITGMQKGVRELRLDNVQTEEVEEVIEERTDGEIGEKVASESLAFVEPISANGNATERSEVPPRDTATKELDSSAVESPERNKSRASVEEAFGTSNGAQREKPKSDAHAESTSRTDETFNEAGDGTQGKDVDDQANAAEGDQYGVEQGYIEDPNETRQYEQQDPSQMQQYDQQDPNQAQQYEQQDPNQLQYEQQDPSQQYYGQSEQYEGAGTALDEYQRYADQGYAQEGQEYVEYVEGDGSYGQYVQDPSGQQYQNDPNAQYQQDPNQAYDYGYDQSYDPAAQGYEGNPNQAYAEYAEGAPYDPNQTYDPNQYGAEYGGEQQPNPDDYDGAANIESGGEAKPDAKEETPDLEQKSEGEVQEDKDEPQRQADAVEDTSQSKKKKDVIKSLLDSDTDTTIEKNVSNTESDFDFN